MDYTVSFTDPANGSFIMKPYTANGPAVPSSGTLFPGAISANTSLILWGQGEIEYGEPFANDMVHLLENFAKSTAPFYPIQGQLWYKNDTGVLSIYDGTSWSIVAPITLTSGAVTTALGFTPPTLTGAGASGNWGINITGNATNATTASATNALTSATTIVNVSSATAPTTGQVLTATSGTAATWQNLAATNISVANNTSSVSTWYPVFVSATTGSLPITADGSVLTFVPSTGTLSTTTFNGALSGNAATSTALHTPRNINGVAFDGTSDIVVAASAVWGSIAGTITSQTDLAAYISNIPNNIAVNGLSVGCGFGNITNNVIFGNNTFASNTVGAYNTAIGYAALSTNVSGSNNVALGASAGFLELGSNALYIDGTGTGTTTPLIKGTFDPTGGLAGNVTINGSLTVTGAFSESGGGLALAISGVATTPYTATASDYTLRVDATSAPITVNLPASPVHGEIKNIKKIDVSVNVVIINGNGHNIDGAATVSISAQYSNLTLQYDTISTTWSIL
jgi:hypothetical protein